MGTLRPIVSKQFCSTSYKVFVVRKRPQAVNGGGFVVTNQDQDVVFTVEGCGTLGVNGELILRQGDRTPLLLIQKKVGLMQALSLHRQWRAYSVENHGQGTLVFTLRTPSSCLVKKCSHKVQLAAEIIESNHDWDFEIIGSFFNRSCTVVDHEKKMVAKINGAEVQLAAPSSKDVYSVGVQPGIDQAFVFGVIAMLDNIFGDSTGC